MTRATLDAECDCYTCTQLQSWLISITLKSVAKCSAAQLNTIHNLRFYQRLMAGLRDAIAEGQLDAFADEFYQKTSNW